MRKGVNTRVLAISGLVVLVLIVWRVAAREGNNHEGTFTVTTSDVIRRVVVQGVVLPLEKTPVYSDQPGRVTAVLASKGDRVRRGQPLFKVDSTRLLRELRRKDIAVERARLQVDGMYSAQRESQIQLRRLELKQALLERDTILQDIHATTYRSPIDGVVVQVAVRAGDHVAPGGPAVPPPVILAASDRAAVEVAADEFESMQVRSGMRALVYLATSPQHAIRGRVSNEPSLVRLGDGQGVSSQYSIRIELESRLADVRMGQSARAEIEVIRKTSATVVPLASVLRDGDTSYVLEQTGGGVRRRDVVIGASDDYMLEIVDGLKPGSVIVTNPWAVSNP